MSLSRIGCRTLFSCRKFKIIKGNIIHPQIWLYYLFGQMGEYCPPTFDKHHGKFATSDVCFGFIFPTNNANNADYIAIQIKR